MKHSSKGDVINMEKTFKYKALSVRSMVDLKVNLNKEDRALEYEFISKEDFELAIKNCHIDDKELKQLHEGFLNMYDTFLKLTNMEEIFKHEYLYKPIDRSILNQVKFRLNDIVNMLSAEMGCFINTTDFAKFLFDAHILGNDLYMKVIKKHLFHRDNGIDIKLGSIPAMAKFGVTVIPAGIAANKRIPIGGNNNGKEK